MTTSRSIRPETSTVPPPGSGTVAAISTSASEPAAKSGAQAGSSSTPPALRKARSVQARSSSALAGQKALTGCGAPVRAHARADVAAGCAAAGLRPSPPRRHPAGERRPRARAGGEPLPRVAAPARAQPDRATRSRADGRLAAAAAPVRGRPAAQDGKFGGNRVGTSSAPAASERRTILYQQSSGGSRTPW